MQGHILVSVMALMLILSTSAIYSARQSFFAVKSSLLERDGFQLDILLEPVLAHASFIIMQLPAPIIPQDLTACSASCVITLMESDFFHLQPMAWWLADNNPVAWKVALQLPDVQAALVLEHLSTEVNLSAGVLTYLRATIIMQHAQGATLRVQVYFERRAPFPLDYQQSAAELATLKSGSIVEVRRLALRRG